MNVALLEILVAFGVAGVGAGQWGALGGAGSGGSFEVIGGGRLWVLQPQGKIMMNFEGWICLGLSMILNKLLGILGLSKVGLWTNLVMGSVQVFTYP